MAVVQLEKKGRLAYLTIARPQALNALNGEVLDELWQGLEEVSQDSQITVVVLRGAGEKAFVAGADIKAMQEMSPLQADEFAKRGQDLGRLLEEMPKIIIAAVQGFALGGGCELAMACDLIYASDRAKFGQPEVNLGVIPGFGGTQRLPRLVGLAQARDILFTGRYVDAQEAKQIGLVADVFEHASFQEQLDMKLKTLLEKSPHALARAKAAIHAGFHLDLNTACLMERQQFALCFASPDQKEGMAAFIEKRTAKFLS